LKFTKAIGKYPRIIITYFITLIGWVLFRAETLTFAFDYIKRMFAFDGVKTNLYFDLEFRTMMVMGAVFGFIAAFGRIEQWWMTVLTKEKKTWILAAMTLAAILFTMICIASITSSGFNPFIYFRF
jgi:alginate O-acetyltransferase complex protein AlgI